MKRLSIAALAGTIVLALCRLLPAQQYWNWSPEAEHHQAAVSVSSTAGSGGSGVYIRDGELLGVLTAAHVTDRAPFTLTWLDGSTKKSSDFYTDKFDNDVAFILIEHEGKTPLAVAKSEPRVGDLIEVMGYGGPERHTLRHYTGKLTEVGNRLKSDARVINGDSGGAWLVNGQVVGVMESGGYPVAGVHRDGNSSWPVFGYSNSPGWRPIRNFLDRVQDRCGPDGCPSQPGGPTQPGGPNPLYPPTNPTQPQPQPQPIAGPPGPPGADGKPGPPGPKGEDGKDADVEAIVRAILIQIKSDESFRGKDGRDGKDAPPVDTEKIVDLVLQKMPPLHVEYVDKEGRPLGKSATVHLDRQVLQLYAGDRLAEQLRGQK